MNSSSLRIICLILVIFYFAAMSRFYFLDSYVFDYLSYLFIAKKPFYNVSAFSSLFHLISHYLGPYQKVLHGICLSLMTISLGLIIYSLGNLIKNKIHQILFVTWASSSGLWYYFYGKLHYDLPYSAFSLGLVLLIFSKLAKDEDIFSNGKNNILEYKNQNSFYLVCIFFALLGLYTSWKSYNIFLTLNLFLLSLTCKPTRSFFFPILKSANNIKYKKALKHYVIYIFAFVLTYFMGNFSFSINGMKGYPAKSTLMTHFFEYRKGWDHVNLAPFNLSNYCVVSAIIIMLILPFLIRKPKYFILNFLIIFIHCIFLKNFSPGYPWHSFPQSFYIMILLFFYLKELENVVNKKAIQLIFFSVIIQAFMTFYIYIPMQYDWHLANHKIEDLVKKNGKNIFKEINKLNSKYEQPISMQVNFFRLYDKQNILKYNFPQLWNQFDKKFNEKKTKSSQTILAVVQFEALFGFPFFLETLPHAKVLQEINLVEGIKISLLEAKCWSISQLFCSKSN